MSGHRSSQKTVGAGLPQAKKWRRSYKVCSGLHSFSPTYDKSARLLQLFVWACLCRPTFFCVSRQFSFCSQLTLPSVVQDVLLCCWQCVLFPAGTPDICLCALRVWLCTAWSRSSSEPVASAAGLETVWHAHSHGARRRAVLPRFGRAAAVPMLPEIVHTVSSRTARPELCWQCCLWQAG